MVKGKRMVSIIVMIIFLLLAGMVMYQLFGIKRESYRYQPADKLQKNPMMGFTPNADYIDAVGDNTLVYVDVTWRELEPEEGHYDFDGIREANYLAKWREEGKKVVFRFVCDEPGNEPHMDIPDWLYEKTKDGTFYDCAYGKGYSPDYNNETLIAYHKKAIKALGEEFGQDSFFCFIELGSLGHWGEWHVKYDEGITRIPSEEVCRQYVIPYLESFPKAKLLMRRPFSFVTEYGMGVYNDMTGEPESTATWLDWIANGSVYDEAETPLTLPACDAIWEKQPVGGEFTSSIPLDVMLTTELEQTISLLQDSHMTFIGPMCPIANREEKEYPEETVRVLENIGYRYGVTEAVFTYDKLFGKMKLQLELKNSGVAPMYFDWPVCIYVLNEKKEVLARFETGIKLTELSKDEITKTRLELPKELFAEEFPILAVGIENPETKEPEVALNMQTGRVGYRYILNEK